MLDVLDPAGTAPAELYASWGHACARRVHSECPSPIKSAVAPLHLQGAGSSGYLSSGCPTPRLHQVGSAGCGSGAERARAKRSCSTRPACDSAPQHPTPAQLSPAGPSTIAGCV